MSYKSLCVVITDWGDLRDQIFSRTGFAPSGAPGIIAKAAHCTRVSQGDCKTGEAEGGLTK